MVSRAEQLDKAGLFLFFSLYYLPVCFRVLLLLQLVDSVAVDVVVAIAVDVVVVDNIAVVVDVWVCN